MWEEGSQGERNYSGSRKTQNSREKLERAKSKTMFWGLWEAIRELWGKLIQLREVPGRKRQAEQEKNPVQVSWENMFGSEEYEDSKDDEDSEGILKENRQKTEIPAFDGTKEPEEGRDTVLLTDLGTEESKNLHRLCSLDGESEDIVLSYYPFIIGKQENLVDYILQKETVSRLHLKIEQIEEEYFIQDLNSTNGTSVAGRMLENNEAARLHPGDEVCIARYRYRFE